MNIIITGASRGIGYELTKIFSQQNELHIFIISRNKEKLENLKKECTQINPQTIITPIVADFSNKEEADKIAKIIKEHQLSIDILINNAGHLVNKAFEKIHTEDLFTSFAVNFITPFQLIQSLLPLFNKQEAHIINISSMGGFQNSVKFKGLTAYSASKAAICNLTETLAEELKDTNIKTNCLALGSVQTEMLSEAFPEYRATVQPEEIAKFIHNFALDGNKFMNGKIIPVSLSTP